MLDFFSYIENAVWIILELQSTFPPHFNLSSQSFNLKVRQKSSGGMMVKVQMADHLPFIRKRFCVFYFMHSWL